MGLPITSWVDQFSNLAFEMASDVKRSGTYQRRKGSTYDPTTGAIVPNQVDVPIEFIVTPYSEKEVDGKEIQFGDEKAIIRFKQLGIAGVTDVGRDDLLVQADGPTRQVIGFRLDSTKQVLTLHVRIQADTQ